MTKFFSIIKNSHLNKNQFKIITKSIMRLNKLHGIVNGVLYSGRRGFLCANAQKRLDKFVEFSYIAVNQLPKKNEHFSMLHSVFSSEFNS